jgi:hypothetical protein
MALLARVMTEAAITAVYGGGRFFLLLLVFGIWLRAAGYGPVHTYCCWMAMDWLLGLVNHDSHGARQRDKAEGMQHGSSSVRVGV